MSIHAGPVVTRSWMRVWPALSCAAVVALVGCKGRDAAATTSDAAPSSASATSSAPVVTVTATDFAFDAPAEVPAGMTSMVLVNNGQQMHHVQLFKLTDGKTMADLAPALKNPGPPPPWMVAAGGPNAAAPGASTRATVLLTPGNYVMVCVIPGPDGVPHVAKGMVRPLTVTNVQNVANPAPSSDVAVTLTDYAFTLSAPLTAGTHTVLVDNKGTMDHEVVFVRLAPGKTAKDVVAWVYKQEGPPPVEGAGGITAVAAGTQGYFTSDFAPGNYALLCFVPDAKDGKPHVAHGMVKEFTI